ncbi:UNVERIFIED_CONTAM: hypothetical protein FKN15_035826 [Acipenser sinensis]
MERYESWLRDPSTLLWLKTEGRHLLEDSNLDILLDFIRLEPEVQEKAITRGYPGLIEALEPSSKVDVGEDHSFCSVSNASCSEEIPIINTIRVFS